MDSSECNVFCIFAMLCVMKTETKLYVKIVNKHYLYYKKKVHDDYFDENVGI